MTRKKLFVSFDFDNDATLKMLFVNQSKHPGAPFDIWDSSVKQHMEGDWQTKVRAKMRDVDIVCVLCSTTTHTAKGVAIELQIAKDLGKPYFLLWGYKDKVCNKPTSATQGDKIYKWEWEQLKKLIHGDR